MSSQKNNILKQDSPKEINDINFKKRTLENNTHEVIEDTKIKCITSWRKSQKKFLNNLIYNILTFGILHLISLNYPNLYVKLYCVPWPAKECDFFLVENIYGHLTLCLKIHKKNNNNNSGYIDNSNEKFILPLNGINFNPKFNITKNLTYSFIYKSTTYEYDEENNEIIPVYMNLSNIKNKEILNYFEGGLYSEKIIKKYRERYGKNVYKIDIQLFLLFLKKNEIPSFLIVMFIGIIEIILQDYISFFIKIIIVILILIIEYLNMRNIIYKKYEKEYTLDGNKNKIKVKRKYLIEDNNFYIEINNEDLLPGDIIYLKANDYVPCDCILIEGECLVNESNLTGNLDIFKKTPLENNNELFSYKTNSINILFHGMKIIKIFSKSSKDFISVLCINIGPNTYKANQYSNILYIFERKKEYNNAYSYFGNRKKVIFIYMIFDFVFSIFFSMIYYYVFMSDVALKLKQLLLRIILRNLCKSLMSVYFITNSILVLVNIIRLRSKNIICFDKSRLFNANKINTIVFSKINTLSKSILEINGYHPVFINNQRPFNLYIKNYNPIQCKDLNIHLLNYYKNYLNNNSFNNMNCNIRHELSMNFNNNKVFEIMVLFIECLISCNDIDKFNTELFGNNIEIQFFNDMKWDLKYNNYTKTKDDNYKSLENDKSFSNKLNYNKKSYDNEYLVYNIKNDIFPRVYYTIAESIRTDLKNLRLSGISYDSTFYNDQFANGNDILKNNDNNKENEILEDIRNSKINSYKLRIYKKFIKYGTINSCAIVYNFMTKELRFNIKGMPEDILINCNRNTFPDNLENILLDYRKSGFIIIICATKLIDLEEYSDLNGLDYYMNNLSFCGFITLKNTLKEETKTSIEYLNKFNHNLIIASGDNQYNCLGVGFESGIIKYKNIFVFDKDEKYNRISINKYFSTKISNNNEIIEENEDKKTNVSNNEYSRQTTQNFKRKNNTSPFNINESKKNMPKFSPKIKPIENTKEETYLTQNQIFSPKTKLMIKHRNKFDKRIAIHMDSDKRKLNILTKSGRLELTDEFNLDNDFSEISKNDEKDTKEKKVNNKIEPKLSLKNIKKITNNLKNERSEKNYSLNKSKNNEYNLSQDKKSRITFNNGKFFYYSGIFNANEELNDNCIYCVSGKLFNFLYKNKKNKKCQKFLEQINKYCRIFFNMSSLDKSLLIDFLRENPNNFICKIGNCQNDYDSILSSNIGISFREPKNQNKILCHFYSPKADILSINNIIKEGKIFNENILLLQMSSFFCTLSINSYILCCFIRSSDAIKGQLNILELIFLILSILSFSGPPIDNFYLEPLSQNELLLNKYYTFQFIGFFIIKLLSIYLLCFFYSTDLLLDENKVDAIFCSYYFILIIEQLISANITFNCLSFYKISPFQNPLLMIFIIFLFFYLILLVTLNSTNYKTDFFKITYFEYFEHLMDSYGDNNRIHCFFVCIFDFFGSLIYSQIIFYIFNKIAKYKISASK